jgi:DNA-binding MarR family transcriptional regulator
MIDPRNSIPRWVSLLYRYGQMYIGDQLKHTEIGKGQHIFLNALYNEDGLSQEELSHHLKIDKGTTAKALKKLEGLGYVKRKVCSKEEQRVAFVILEKMGANAADCIKHNMKEGKSL